MSSLAAQSLQSVLDDRGPMEHWRSLAAERRARVALPEADDERVLAAAIVLRELELARPVLMGAAHAVRSRLADLGADPGALEILDLQEDPRRIPLAQRLLERRRQKGLTQGESQVLLQNPLHFAAALAATDEVDAVVAGAAHPTAEVIRAGLYHAGLAPGIDVVSGAFLMLPPDAGTQPLLFADAAVIPEPSEDELVAIAKASAQTFENLLGRDPRIACLSFSTLGSADHERARRMARVAERLHAEGLDADGELQFDAAVDEGVARKKAPHSPVAGRADVLLFPSLEAANIGYKIAQRMGGWGAVGPLVQGLARPIYDLSRGCSVLDVVNTTALAVLSRK